MTGGLLASPTTMAASKDRTTGRHAPHGVAVFLEHADPETPLDELSTEYQEWKDSREQEGETDG